MILDAESVVRVPRNESGREEFHVGLREVRFDEKGVTGSIRGSNKMRLKQKDVILYRKL